LLEEIRVEVLEPDGIYPDARQNRGIPQVGVASERLGL